MPISPRIDIDRIEASRVDQIGPSSAGRDSTSYHAPVRDWTNNFGIQVNITNNITPNFHEASAGAVQANRVLDVILTQSLLEATQERERWFNGDRHTESTHQARWRSEQVPLQALNCSLEELNRIDEKLRVGEAKGVGDVSRAEEANGFKEASAVEEAAHAAEVIYVEETTGTEEATRVKAGTRVVASSRVEDAPHRKDGVGLTQALHKGKERLHSSKERIDAIKADHYRYSNVLSTQEEKTRTKLAAAAFHPVIPYDNPNAVNAPAIARKNPEAVSTPVAPNNNFGDVSHPVMPNNPKTVSPPMTPQAHAETVFSPMEPNNNKIDAVSSPEKRSSNPECVSPPVPPEKSLDAASSPLIRENNSEPVSASLIPEISVEVVSPPLIPKNKPEAVSPPPRPNSYPYVGPTYRFAVNDKPSSSQSSQSAVIRAADSYSFSMKWGREPETTFGSGKIFLTIPLIGNKEVRSRAAIEKWLREIMGPRAPRFKKDSVDIDGSVSVKGTSCSVRVKFSVVKSKRSEKLLEEIKQKDPVYAILCFNIGDGSTLQKVETKWIKLARECHFSETILLGFAPGNSSIRRQGLERRQNQGSTPFLSDVSEKEGLAVAAKCQASAYFECSEENAVALDRIFTALIGSAAAVELRKTTHIESVSKEL